MRIIQDSREQAPYTFNAPRYAGTVVEVGVLQTGDYSLAGLTDRIALERKSLSDLCGTLTTGRERFQRECERGRGLEYFGLVIEASMDDVRRHNYRSAMTPQSLLQTLAAWSIRYGLHVHWCGSREGCEYMVHSLLEKFLKEQQTRLAALVKAHGAAA
jgi:DNA excision repair protein ERCC-4